MKDGAALGLAIGIGLALAEPAGRLLHGAPSWAPTDLHRTTAQTNSGLPSIPYGLDRGLCDRPQVASDMRTDGRASLIVGDSVGSRMDMVDQGCIGASLEFAPDQRRVLWRNPDSGVNYAVTANRTYQNDRGGYCREFDTSAVLGSQLRQARTVACRQTDGLWAAIR